MKKKIAVFLCLLNFLFLNVGCSNNEYSANESIENVVTASESADNLFGETDITQAQIDNSLIEKYSKIINNGTLLYELDYYELNNTINIEDEYSVSATIEKDQMYVETYYPDNSSDIYFTQDNTQYYIFPDGRQYYKMNEEIQSEIEEKGDDVYEYTLLNVYDILGKIDPESACSCKIDGARYYRLNYIDKNSGYNYYIYFKDGVIEKYFINENDNNSFVRVEIKKFENTSEKIEYSIPDDYKEISLDET
ncbi:MAG: hypothetical protein Q4F95_03395 [Oscillospiraceae bacterium]|nr:hypothetical protein [Oscillospiraceae bacterium]